MKHFYIAILCLLLAAPLLLKAQQVSNIHFEQAGKQIHISYNLKGEGTYNIKVYCSTDNDQTWGEPLRKVTGAVGKNQQPGNNKEIVWDVLAEREKLTGEIKFKIEAASGNTGYFTDTRDGQTYKWVKIGNQIWMAENLNYNTGNSWCYDNSIANCNRYGRLYDWRTAIFACPKGWHLPSDTEWDILVDFLGGSNIAGNKMKSTTGWNNNGNGTDEVSFSALPGGYRYVNGNFFSLGSSGYWWSAMEYRSTHAWTRGLDYGYDEVDRYRHDKGYSFSVRCVRD